MSFPRTYFYKKIPVYENTWELLKKDRRVIQGRVETFDDILQRWFKERKKVKA